MRTCFNYLFKMYTKIEINQKKLVLNEQNFYYRSTLTILPMRDRRDGHLVACLIHHRPSITPRSTFVAEAGAVRVLKGSVPGVTMASVTEL